MNKSFEVGVQYSVPTTGMTLDPLTKVSQSVLDKVERHSDRFFHAASKELVVSYNTVVNISTPDLTLSTIINNVNQTQPHSISSF